MATEKLTIIPPLSVRLTESQARDVQGLADMHGMEKGEYIRHLVSEDKEKQRRIWESRNQLFAPEDHPANGLAHDDVGRSHER